MRGDTEHGSAAEGIYTVVIQELFNKKSALKVLMRNKRHVQNQSTPNDYQRVAG